MKISFMENTKFLELTLALTSNSYITEKMQGENVASTLLSTFVPNNIIK